MPSGFWVLDESVRYMQGTSLLTSPELPPSVLLPAVAGEEMDPYLAPVPFHYGFVEGGRVFAQYSPLLALVSVPFRAVAGRVGMYAVPAMGTALFWMILASCFLGSGFTRTQALLLPLTGTSLLFYGMTFWSHSIAAALVVAAVSLTMLHRGTAVAVLLISVAALFREEALPFLAFPLLLGEASPRRKLLLLGASGLGLLALTRLLTGSWAGTHLQASGMEQDLYGHSGSGYLAARPFVFVRTMLSFMPGIPMWGNVAGGISLIGLWTISAFSRRKTLGEAATVIGLAMATAALLAAAIRGFRLLDTLYFLKNPLVVMPALWLAVPRGRQALLSLAVLLLMLAVMGPMHSEDLAWGSRLTMLPLLALLPALKPLSGRRTWAVIAVGVLACAVSTGFLQRKRSVSSDLNALVSSEGGAVIVTSWLLAGEFAVRMEEGVPVAFTPTATDFALAVGSLGPLEPVIVSRFEDIEGQMELFREIGIAPSIGGVVEFDPALRVAVMTFSAAGQP